MSTCFLRKSSLTLFSESDYFPNGAFDKQDRLVAVTLSEVSKYIDIEGFPAQLVERVDDVPVEASPDIKQVG